MKEIKYPSNAEVYVHQEQDVQLFKEDDITNRIKDFATPGIVLYPVGASVGQGRNFLIEQVTTTTIRVGYIAGSENGGTAYTRDTDGRWQRISIGDGLTANKNYVSSNPADPLNSGMKVTPPWTTPNTDPYGQPLYQTSGNNSIPLGIGGTTVPNTTYYVWVDYLQVVDQSGPTVDDEEGVPRTWYVNYLDGYVVYVIPTSTLPPTSSSIALGTVTTGNSGLISTISQTGLVYAAYRGTSVAGITPADDTDVTTTYTYNQQASFEDHIKAKGSGTLSPTNPHGVAAIDLGIGADANVGTHQQNLHSSGITNGDPSLAATSSLRPYTDTGVGQHVRVHPLTGFELLVIQAVAYTPSTSITRFLIDGTTEASTLGAAYDSGDFAGLLVPAGEYYLYIDATSPSALFLRWTSAVQPSSPTFFLLAHVSWNGSVFASTAPAVSDDYRIFRNLTPMNMWFTSGRPSVQGAFGFNLTNSFFEGYNGVTWHQIGFPPTGTSQFYDSGVHTGSAALTHNLTVAGVSVIPDVVLITLQTGSTTGVAWEISRNSTVINVGTTDGSVAYRVVAWKTV